MIIKNFLKSKLGPLAYFTDQKTPVGGDVNDDNDAGLLLTM